MRDVRLERRCCFGGHGDGGSNKKKSSERQQVAAVRSVRATQRTIFRNEKRVEKGISSHRVSPRLQRLQNVCIGGQKFT